MKHEMSVPTIALLSACALLVVAIGGCSHTVPSHRARMASTPPQGLPPVDEPSRTASRAAIPLSSSNPVESDLRLTLTGDLSSMQRTISAALPNSIDDSRHPLSSQFRWSFKRQGEPQVWLENGALHVRSEYQGQIEPRNGIAEACQLNPVYPVVEWRGDLSTKPGADPSAFSIQPVASRAAVTLGPQSDTKCNMFASPLPEQLRGLLEVDRMKESIDQAVERSGTEFTMRPVWTQLHGPYAIEFPGSNDQICLYPEPTEVRLGRMEGTLQRAVIYGSARVFPIAIIQQRCHAPKLGSNRISTEVPVNEPRFQLETLVPIPYEQLAQNIGQTVFRTETTLDRGFFGEEKAVVDNIKAEHAAGKVLITVETSGDLNGPLYYWGTPQLEGRFITVPDLQMDLETRKVLEAEEAGLAKKLDSNLRERLIRAVRTDVSADIARTKRALSGPHKGEAFLLDLELDQGKPTRVYAAPQGLLTMVSFEGRARLEGTLPVVASAASSSRAATAASGSRAQDMAGNTLTGRVSQIEGQRYVIQQPSGTEIRLLVDRDSIIEQRPKLGDQIVVELAQDGRVRAIRPARR